MPYKASRAAWTRLLRFRSQCQNAQVGAARWHACMDELRSGAPTTARADRSRAVLREVPAFLSSRRGPSAAISRLAGARCNTEVCADPGERDRSGTRQRECDPRAEIPSASGDAIPQRRAARPPLQENFTPCATHFPGRCASLSACGLLPRWSTSARLRPANSAEFSDNCATSKIWARY